MFRSVGTTRAVASAVCCRRSAGDARHDNDSIEQCARRRDAVGRL